MTPFLAAKWKYVAMINYAIDPAVLEPFIPRGTELDLWKGEAYISLVGFMFLDTYVKGYSIPFHRNFEEVNLRFYVKKKEDGRRGVVFIKEIVPRWAIAFVARQLYNENYVALPMKHRIEQQGTQISVEYQWKFEGEWHKIGLKSQVEPQFPSEGSEAEFISEHYWGYNIQKDGGTIEYQVQHPRWRIWEPAICEVSVDVPRFYGEPFAPFLKKKPASAFLAEGSEVVVFNASFG